MSYALKDIHANPFRQLERYPINQAKIDALRESIRTTGFWDNLLARENGNGPELAYGHHRLRALLDEYGPSHKIALTIRDLDDEQMLRIMARENTEEWAANVLVEYETVRAVVEAYGAGRIKLPAPERVDPRYTRYAPGFSFDNKPSALRAYSAQTVGTFIGWVRSDGQATTKVHDALNALELIEAGVLDEARFEGLTTMQARATISETHKTKRAADTEAQRKHEQAEQEQIKADAARRSGAPRDAKLYERRQRAAEAAADQHRRDGQKKAKHVAEGLSASMRSGELGWREAPAKARSIAGTKPKDDGPPPDIDKFAEALVKKLGRTLTVDDPQTAKLDELLKHAKYMSRRSRRDLVTTLGKVGRRADKYADRLNKQVGTTRQAVPRIEKTTTGG